MVDSVARLVDRGAVAAPEALVELQVAVGMATEEVMLAEEATSVTLGAG